MRTRTAACIVFALAGQIMSARQPAGLERGGWLQGCWALTTPARSVEENWTTPKGGRMIDTGRTIRDGKLAERQSPPNRGSV